MSSSSKNSTEGRKRLARFVDCFGDIMVKKCSTCEKHKRVCKVNLRSGRCNQCLHRNQRCDVKVTQSEFEYLKREKERLRSDIQKAREAQDNAHQEEERLRVLQEKAREDSRVAFAKEMRLRQQMDFLDRRADEAIAVEEANVLEAEGLEQQELLMSVDFGAPMGGLALNLSPHTWSAIEDLPENFWEFPEDTVVASSGSS